MENKFVNLIEATKQEIQYSEELIKKYTGKEMKDAEGLRLATLKGKLDMLEDLFFDYTIENLNRGMIEVDELSKKYNGGTDHE